VTHNVKILSRTATEDESTSQTSPDRVLPKVETQLPSVEAKKDQPSAWEEKKRGSTRVHR